MENLITRDSEIIRNIFSRIQSMEEKVDQMLSVHLSGSENWINGEEVMRILGISKRTLQNYRDNGTLPYSAIGGKIYYSRKDIEELMRKNHTQSSL